MTTATATTTSMLREIGQMLRVDAVRASAAAGSGHPTSAMSAADLMAVLLARYLRYNFDDPADLNNDQLIFSKGHASPLLYAMYRAAGAITDEELLTFRRRGSRLEGHPTPAVPWVPVATGSLGQGLGIGVGMALAAKRLNRSDARVWVLCGDSELAEGAIWEAFEHAAFYDLDNMTAILDVNRLGQRGETMVARDLERYRARVEAFGWHAVVVDGHDVEAIDGAYREAVQHEGQPTAIIANTIKGKGVAAVEDRNGFHGKPLPDPEAAIAELGGRRSIVVSVAQPAAGAATVSPDGDAAAPILPSYQRDEMVATRQAYAEALVALASSRPELVVLDGEVSNSTRTGLFQAAFPERFFEMYIAEQQMLAAAVGFQAQGWLPVAATFAAFLTRAHDFIRMAAIGRARLAVVGTHAGVSIGQDGPSQMGLEDIAMFRSIPGSTVLYPSDAQQAVELTSAMLDLEGISYLRTTREGTPVLYAPGEQFFVGGSRLLRSSGADELTVVAAGVTVPEALQAAELLSGEIAVRVIDLYSIKPIDVEALRRAAQETRGIVTVEDHRPEGGLGDAVLEVLAEPGVATPVRKLAVRGMPGSATPAEQRELAGIDAAAIAAAARELMRR